MIMKTIKYILLLCMVLLISTANADISIYSYGDTLKSAINLDSGYYAKIDDASYYIFLDPEHAVDGEYIANGDYNLVVGTEAPDSILSASWAIPADEVEGIYYLTSVLTYDGEVLRPQISTFKIGPISTTPSDTLGGYGYIDESTTYSGSTLGPIYLPGGIPAYNAEILVYLNNTNQFVATVRVDASGNFKVWVPSSGTYDINVRYPGYNFAKRGPVVATVP